MRWNRKKNIWPYLAILGCLFLLSVVSPRSWERLRRSESKDQTETEQSAFIRQPADQRSRVVQLKSQQPIYPTRPPVRQLLSSPICPPAMPRATDSDVSATFAFIAVDDYDLTEETSLESQVTTLASPDLSSRLPAEPLPSPREYNLDSLLRLRDALVSLVDRAKQIELPTQSIQQARSNVRVSSENDRLALIPERIKQPEQRVESQAGLMKIRNKSEPQGASLGRPGISIRPSANIHPVNTVTPPLPGASALRLTFPSDQIGTGPTKIIAYFEASPQKQVVVDYRRENSEIGRASCRERG